MKIDQRLWDTDKGRRQFVKRSSHELKNSAKRFKDKRETVQIRISKSTHQKIKAYSKVTRRTISVLVSHILENVLNDGEQRELIRCRLEKVPKRRTFLSNLC
jgi:predicted DNA-binding protein